MFPRHLILPVILVLGLALLGACGGDDEGPDDDGDGTNGNIETPTSEPTLEPTAATGGDPTPTSAGTDTDPGSDEVLDVCALLTLDEVESFLGVPPLEPEAEEPFPPVFGCSWDSELPVINVGVWVWEDEEQAKDSMALTAANDYPEIDGLGDEAYNTQPIDDISFRKGRYEISVGVYFLSDDDAEELRIAQEAAQLIASRLP